MESNRFMLGCTSICPETRHQKLKSQRVYLTMNFYMYVKIFVGVA